MKRTQHPGHIDERRALQATLAQRPGRFAFKIEDNKIFPGKKELAQMIIAMNAHTLRADLAQKEGAEAIQHIIQA